MTERRDFYVYEHRRLDTGAAFYVGKTVSPETREKLRAAALRRPPISDETRAKISAKNQGKIVSPETRKKLRAAAFRRWAPAIVTPEMLEP